MRSCGLGCLQALRPPRGRGRQRRDGERPRAHVPRISPGRLPASRGLPPQEKGGEAGRLRREPAWLLPSPPGRNELTSARPGNAAEARSSGAPAGLARPSSSPGRRRGGHPKRQAARANEAVPPPGGPAEESRRPGRGRRSPGPAPEDALKDPPGRAARARAEIATLRLDRASPPFAAAPPNSLSPSLLCSPSLQSNYFLQHHPRFFTLTAGCKLLPNSVDF